MDTAEPSHRPWFDLRAILVLAFLVVVACLVVWSRAESYSREQFLWSLKERNVVWSVEREIDLWSTEWPFHNVKQPTAVYLRDGLFTDEDVRRLRWYFPGTTLFRTEQDESPNEISAEPLDPWLDHYPE